MSLLDTGNELVEVWPETTSTDPDGNPVRIPAADPVQVRARVQPVSSNDVAAAGQQTVARYRLITREAPLGPWARVRWDGRDWDIDGEPLRSNGSRRTRHVQAILKARGAGEA
ncbi:head-tail adaptor protein [Nocardiopsis sp. TNDT3]|uniref:phage head completion protein n=1 Tax=Nocardiopsis sp. TNDT3 TaxID=2249354 RepID=UPI000E3C1832|nr:head-tail adaptor protein [Nocardiopsis sp. TNDT3]